MPETPRPAGQTTRPQPTPPAAKPVPTPPAAREVPQPSEFRDRLPAGADERIAVGDPEQAMARLGQDRPLRSLDPARQPPAPWSGKELKKGGVYVIVNAEDLDQPRRGRVVRLTRTPGKYVGVEFADPVGPHVVHDCDGAGKLGHCLYCRFDQVLTDEEYKAYAERYRAAAAQRPPLEDLDSLRLEITPDGGQAVK